jgi:hypothetical protein
MQTGIDAGTAPESYLATTAMVMGLGSLIGAIVLLFLKLGTARPSDAPVTEGKGIDPSLA